MSKRQLPEGTRVWVSIVLAVLVVLFILMCANVVYGPASEPSFSPLTPTPSPHETVGWVQVPDAGLRPYAGSEGG